MRPLLFLGAAFLSLVGSGVVYVAGVWSGHFVDSRAWDRICTARPLDAADPYGRVDWFPLVQQCRWRDGTTTDLVPPWVNPLLFSLLALAFVCLVLAARTAVGRPRELRNHA